MLQSEYQRKRTTVADELGRIQNGQTIYLAGAPLLPVDFADGMKSLKGKVRGVEVLNYLPLSPLEIMTQPGYEDTFHFQSVFFNKVQQRAQSYGSCDFIPNHLRNAARDWAGGVAAYDLMVLTVSPMDRHGYFSLAGGAQIELELLSRAKRLVVEVASRAPRVFGDVLLHISQIDALWESDRHPSAAPRAVPDQVDVQLGQVVADLVEDGATIQLGFGGTIDALASQLKHKRGLGIHTEALSDAAMELIQCGAVDNSNKTLHRGYTVTSFSLGSTALYDFVNDNPAVHHRRLSYTNDPYVMAQNHAMTSINASLQVDLSGQCASESIGTMQYSGSGGQVDTAVGAQMAPGGKSIITLRSTYTVKDKTTGAERLCSRVVPVLPAGTVVTLTRTNTHFVATEYGAVCLRGLTVPQRARALISIAHPQFRSQLEEEFAQHYHQSL